MNTVSASLVPTYIKASSAEELRTMILKLNMITNTYREYNITKDKGSWYAWFYWDALEELPNLIGE